jgi:hypothetical protein
MSRRAATIVSLGLIAATLEPLARAPADDGFPLSTFPMFAAPRSTALALSYAEGATRDGGTRALRPDHLGTGEVMQAFATLQRAADAGAGELGALCAAIAARVAGDAAYGDVAEIRIVTGTHDAVAYVLHGAARSAIAPVATRARCEIRRGAP